MTSKEMLLAFLEYNFSADERICQKVAQLAPEQLHTLAAISHGTAFNLVRHILDTEWSWRLFAAGEGGQKYLWEVEDIPDLPAIQRFWSEEKARMLAFAGSLSEADLGRSVDYGTAQGGQPRFLSVWKILLHVVNHGTHHRSELSRYLEQCGYPVEEQDLDFGSFVGGNGS
jgi:uncharacterized damage-inducible protein DinB